jgi:hypothetical protein
MTIEEKYNNAIQMLRSYYDGKNENLRISSSVLKENGFGEDFWQMICPRLQREGVLRENPMPFIGDTGKVINQEKYNRLQSQWERIMSAIMALSSSDRYNPQYSFGPSPETTKKLVEKEELEKEMNSLERIYHFVVDGKKLIAEHEKHKAVSGGDAGRDARGKTALEKQPTTLEKSLKSIVRLIAKHQDDGDYFYKDKRIVVNRKTLYYDVFDILFLYSDQEGFLSYEQIESKLVERNHLRAKDDEKRNKRIQNAILNEQQGFFKNAKIGNSKMKNKIPDGTPLVEGSRGNGLKLNNPIVK